MGFCVDCEKCKRTYDTKYFPEFCPWCYVGYDELSLKNQKLKEALEYYAHPEHYEEWQSLGGIRPPGVLVEQGKKAREALAACEKGTGADETEEERDGNGDWIWNELHDTD